MPAEIGQRFDVAPSARYSHDRTNYDRIHERGRGLPEQSKEKVPFAFDLRSEYEKINKYGEQYKEFFVSQAEYYAKEAYGRVPKATYSHEIERQPDGSVKLRFGPGGDYAEESYAEPTRDKSFPEWYRARSEGDVRWTRALQEKLKDAEFGDVFLDLSPTELNVDVAERKKWGFGWHSFVRVHEYVIENGQEKLVSRALRNYLDLPEQEELFKRLTGERVGGKDLLGSVEKLKPELSMGVIDGVVQELYNNTPQERKIIPPDSDLLFKTSEEMQAKLSRVNSWLEGIFYMMKHRVPKSDIQRQFRGWENIIKDLAQGKDIDTSYFESLDPREFARSFIRPYKFEETQREEASREETPVGFYSQQQYRPGASGCGNGSGFSEGSGSSSFFGSGGGEMTFGSMSYQSMSANGEDYGFDRIGACRTCGQTAKCGPCRMCESCDNRAKKGEKLTEFEPAVEESYQEAA